VRDSFYLAWQYIRFNRWKSITLVACVMIIAFLPLALELLLDESEKQLVDRATSTPLVVGARGSALDLVMNALYFGEQVPRRMTMAAADAIEATDLALPIPMYVRFRARGAPIVGTTLDYFDFRGLRIAEGRNLAMLGECVLGAAVAEQLELQPGDDIVSSPENLFDLAGVYPLKMTVVGVLERAHSSDDLAIFVDIKTTWIIQGLGHGHQDLQMVTDPQSILGRSDTSITASAKLFHYTEITPDNVNSFHFHGGLAEYPVTAVLVEPHDDKSGTILQGRYIGDEATEQIIRPREVVDELLANIFRIKNLLDAVILLVGLATLLAITLVFALSIRLRSREMDTVFRLGCRRATMVRLVGAEIVTIVAAGALAGMLAMLILQQFASELVRSLIIR